MIESDGAEEEKKKSRGQDSGAGAEQPNAKESPLFVRLDDERRRLFRGVFTGNKRELPFSSETRPDSSASQALRGRAHVCSVRRATRKQAICLLSGCRSRPKSHQLCIAPKMIPFTLDCRQQIRQRAGGAKMLIWLPDPA